MAAKEMYGISLLVLLLCVAACHGATGYVGCFYDFTNGVRDLPIQANIAQNEVTIESCQEWCGVRLFAYAALQFSYQCFCGNSYGSQGQASNSACNMPCDGDSSEICGAGGINSVYTTSNVGYKGCFIDSGTSRDLPTQIYVSSASTVEYCRAACGNAGYAYAGLQYGQECWCGNQYGSNGQAPQSDCSIPCAGDPTETCGNGYRNSIFTSTTSPPCHSNEDCFLNGVCTSGVCHCDPTWTGLYCTSMKFQPAPAIGAYGYAPNVSTWGGVPTLVNNQYHLYVDEMVDGCGLCTWGSNSHIIHATSNNLLGPYTYQNEALPLWSHNAHIEVDRSSGSPVYLLFHVGQANGGVTPQACNSGTHSKKKRDSSGVLHTSSSPNGPFTPANAPGLGGCNNPAPHIFPNGTIILVCAQDGTNVYTAPSWRGPWKQGSLTYKGDAGVGVWEDPFIWVDQRGHYKMIAHVYPSPGQASAYSDRVSGFAYSYDGFTWYRQPWQPYTNIVQHTDGTTVAYTTRERPAIFFDTDGYTPLALFNGVARGTNCWDCKLQCGVDWTFNLAQAFAN
eukprot:Phypoly_transcript_05889.p1 GENE.Phypoly_transcript_05889~~Phypoly_transcript_05889.p1  ORF type:complete len:562 (+),score=58.97 Phypoly_transcript_05889:161-1846(+)